MHALHLIKDFTDYTATGPGLWIIIRFYFPAFWYLPAMKIVRWLYGYLKWTVPPNCFCYAVFDHWLPGRIYYTVLTLLWIKICTDDDDDPFKKGLRRAAGYVKDLGHRLVVTPEPA